MAPLSSNQKELLKIIEKIERKFGLIKAGPDCSDSFGRKLELLSQATTEKNELNDDAKKLLAEVRKPDSELEKTLRNEVMWYDIRSLVWRENPLLSALFALAYASVLIERTGRKNGHTVNIAVDCYRKHYKTMSIFADTLIRTGIFENDGGLIYWGVQNGGSIRNVAEYEKAITGKGGNWVFGTMSHRKEDFAGAKFGMEGKVFCGKDLMEVFYNKLLNADFPLFAKIENPNDFVISVSSLTKNNIAVIEDLIRARTGTNLPQNKLLSGLNIGFDMCGSPIGKNLVDILRTFGADVEVKNEKLDEDFDINKIIDPNEHESEPMLRLKEKAKETKRIYLALDPDGDRGTVIALNSEGKAISLTGTELLLLTAENLATYNNEEGKIACVYDMRTGISAHLLENSLNKIGKPIKFIAAEPGYPFFMQSMSENKDAVTAIENTCHEYLTPFTNPIWGAPKYYSNTQGGDDASIFLTYILGLSKILWEGRNPVEQLDFIRQKYRIPKTIISEFKPSLEKKDAAYKYDIASEMCKIAKEKFGENDKFIIDIMNSGVRITNQEIEAMVLVRYSNTGPAFTVSGEAVAEDGSIFMFKLAREVMNEAVSNIQKKADFAFNWNDFPKYGN